MRTMIKKVTRTVMFETDNGFGVDVDGFENGVVIVEIPVAILPVDETIYIRAMSEDEYVSFIEGCFATTSNFKEELFKAYECSSDTEFLGFELRVQELSCTITNSNCSESSIREAIKNLLLNYAKMVIEEKNDEEDEYNRKMKKTKEILDKREITFRSHQAKTQYEQAPERKTMVDIGYGEAFVKYVQYLLEQDGYDILAAVNETYELFGYLEIVGNGNLNPIQFISKYCLYGDEIYSSYLGMIMQRFSDELNDL